MTKSRNTKRALLLSLLSMMLCVAMLIGCTFAWFTDTATSGTNRIVAGNLDIELQGKIDGEYKPLSEGSLFNADMKWEPGQMYYRELKVQNLGTLATKFSVNISDDIAFNFVLEPNEDGTYTGTDTALMYAIRIAAYNGTFAELTDAVVSEVGSALTDREVVNKALELGLISSDVLANTDPDEGFLFEDTLYPAGNAKSEIEFTLIAYWADKADLESWGFVDDDFNLKNGRKASISQDENEVYDFENDVGRILSADAVSEDGLYVDFDIKVFATQVPFESDSFGNEYDSDIAYVERPILPPEQGSDEG